MSCSNSEIPQRWVLEISEAWNLESKHCAYVGMSKPGTCEKAYGPKP